MNTRITQYILELYTEYKHTKKQGIVRSHMYSQDSLPKKASNH